MLFKTHEGEVLDLNKHQYACLTQGQLEAFVEEYELHCKGLPCKASMGTSNDWRRAQFAHFKDYYGWDFS